MNVPNYSKLIILIHLYFLIDFIKSADDIMENFEMAPVVEIDNATLRSEVTEEQTTTKDSKKREVVSDKNAFNMSEPLTEPNTTLQSKVRKTEPSTLQSTLKGSTIPVTPVAPNKTGTSNLCPYFIYIVGFNMENWADVWQPVYYYKMAEKLTCFKMLVKKTSKKERKHYQKMYGNFNHSIDWNECHFEIESNSWGHRRHFLQGGVGDMGVMRNMLIVKDDNDQYVLKEDTPDQWLMLKGLLLIRDCETGGTVVLARPPGRPARPDVRAAVRELGEQVSGEFVCEEPAKNQTVTQ